MSIVPPIAPTVCFAQLQTGLHTVSFFRKVHPQLSWILLFTCRFRHRIPLTFKTIHPSYSLHGELKLFYNYSYVLWPVFEIFHNNIFTFWLIVFKNFNKRYRGLCRRLGIEVEKVFWFIFTCSNTKFPNKVNNSSNQKQYWFFRKKNL